MTQEAYLRINQPKIVHDLFDDEVVIVNLDSGAYYSLEGTAKWIWQAILKKRSLTQIVQDGVAEFDAAEGEIATAITKFLDELQVEGIVSTTAVAPSPSDQAEARPSATGQTTGKSAFVAPILSRYTDMQDLLLLDPIHDVGAAGWPKPANS